MTDKELLARKLAFIETCISELQRLARPADLRTNIKEERYVTYTLQIAIQAALDTASHVVSAERLGEPATNHDLFDLLESDGWIDNTVLKSMHEINGFRNVVVHGYDDVDIFILEDILKNRLSDLLEFCSQIRARLG